MHRSTAPGTDAIPSTRPGGWRLPVSPIDVKLGARMLLKHPLMTLVAMISLAVGIPVGLAPMHLIAAFEAPLPVPDGDRLFGVRYRNVESSGGAPATAYDLAVWREALTAFEALGAVRAVSQNLDAGSGVGVPVAGAEVSASAFSILRTPALLGRGLQPEDEEPGAPPVVVLGHDVWRSRFAGDPAVVNRTVRVGGVDHTVVGVMPDGFSFPVGQQLWVPLGERSAGEPGRGVPLQVFGRLAEGASPAAARTELEVVARRLRAEHPEAYEKVRAEAVPFTIALQGLPQGGYGSLADIWLIQLIALALLVVACANVGLLIFARTAMRSAELAVRAALGAGRTRIVAQVFVEVLVLAVLSTGVGLLLIELGANRLLAALWSPESGGVPWWVDLGVTPVTMLAALLLAVLSATIASIVPALRVTGRRIQEPLRRMGATGSAVRMGSVSSALIVADMAMAVAAVGLVMGVSDRMAGIALPEAAGLPAEQFLSAEITLPAAAEIVDGDSLGAAERAERVAALQQRLLERLTAEPGVRSVAVGSALPRMDHPMGIVEARGGAPGDRFGGHEVEIADVDPGFFAGLGEDVVAGRGFTAADLEGERSAVIVNRKFVERTLGGRNPVGRQLRYLSFPDGEPGPWYEIVGMVPDLGTNLVEPQNGLGVYHPAAPGEIYPIRLAIRLGSDPGAFTRRLRELAMQADPSATVAAAEPLDQVFPDDWYGMNAFRIGWILFVGVLLVLAASGVYTMMAFSVSQRTREIGIRSALGARPGQIMRAIGGRAGLQVGLGALLGMPLAAWCYFMVQKYTTTPATVFLVAVLPAVAAVLLVGLVACTAPLLRALRVAPTVAMRAD